MSIPPQTHAYKHKVIKVRRVLKRSVAATTDNLTKENPSLFRTTKVGSCSTQNGESIPPWVAPGGELECYGSPTRKAACLPRP